MAGQQFEYGFDDIGNRTETKTGGDESGANLRSASYTATSLNEYTSRDVPGYVEVTGVALETPTVNSQSPYRRGEYFRKELTVNNASAAVWQSVTVATNGVTGATGNIFVPEDTESFTHDDDGNLESDGRWDYEWDGENRLEVMRSLSGSPAPERRLVFEYDAKGRRIRQTVFDDRDDGQGSELSDVIYLYDGWNLMAELDANASNAKVRTYLWGLDLSGSEQGAGGVGGLLQVDYYGTSTTNCFVAYDGNGNVAVLVNAANGETVATYEYGPFGESIRATGPMANDNPFRFSTKYQDSESDLLYYGYRFYNANLGRWPNRDSIEEQGGLNLYAFVGNRPMDYVDLGGLIEIAGTGIHLTGCYSYDVTYVSHTTVIVKKPPFAPKKKVLKAIADEVQGMFPISGEGGDCFGSCRPLIKIDRTFTTPPITQTKTILLLWDVTATVTVTFHVKADVKICCGSR